MADREIQFIPNSDFEGSSESDFADIDVELYALEEGESPQPSSETGASTFLRALEHGRLLTFEGEQFLFKRLNFLRFRANALQVTLRGRKRAPKRDMREIDRLLSEAEQSREEIAGANLRLVASIARKYSTNADEFDEFVSEANAILLNAIDKFDFSRGYRFSTYATHAIQRHLFRVMKRRHRKGEAFAGDTHEIAMSQSAAEETFPGAQAVMDAAESILQRLDEVLTEREKRIVLSRFGLDGQEKPKALRVIGEELGISKERVRQILQQSLEKLGPIASPFEELIR